MASRSPRRSGLIKQIGIEPVVVHPDIDECVDSLSGSRLTEYLARQKAFGVASDITENAVVLGVDTLVKFGSETIGKPENRDEAHLILSRLQGETHSVVSSICLYKTPNMNSISKTSMSYVTFAKMTENEISAYLETGEYVDKAGAYAIQGKAAAFIGGIEGSYTNIVGLPLFELCEALEELGTPIWKFWNLK